MAWKFLSIVKANAEIERLACELASTTKERDELKTAIDANASDIAKELESANAGLAAKDTEISALKAEVESAKAELAKAQEELKAVPVKISQKAAEITAAQGQPPVPVTPPNTLGGGSASSAEDLMGQLNSIKDPSARTEFYRKHYAAFINAARAQRGQ